MPKRERKLRKDEIIAPSFILGEREIRRPSIKLKNFIKKSLK